MKRKSLRQNENSNESSHSAQLLPENFLENAYENDFRQYEAKSRLTSKTFGVPLFWKWHSNLPATKQPKAIEYFFIDDRVKREQLRLRRWLLGMTENRTK